jgi:hypothetical protein
MFPHEHIKTRGLSVHDPSWRALRDETFHKKYRKELKLATSHRYDDCDVSHIIFSSNGGVNAVENMYMTSSRVIARWVIAGITSTLH